MGIVLAQARHVADVANLLAACMRGMCRQGIDQWDEHYPSAEVVAKDVESRSLYVLEEPARANAMLCVAAISLNQEQHPAYQTVRWNGAEPVLVVHRLCVDPAHQGRGIARRMMDFAEELARQRQYTGIRLDTYSGNPPALRLYEGLGYRKVGEVYFRGKTTPFFCFEKIFISQKSK